MALSIKEAFDITNPIHGSVRTTRQAEVLPYSYTKPMNDFGLQVEVDVNYWLDDDNRVEAEILTITFLSADGNVRRQMPLSMFTEDALREMRDEAAGEIEAENDAEWGA